MKEIQFVTGSLNFVGRTVRPGRAVFTSTYRPNEGGHKQNDLITLSEGVQQDLTIWLYFLEQYNGIFIYHMGSSWIKAPVYTYTDASGALGFGDYLNRQWFNGRWPSRDIVDHTSIAWKEMVQILLSIMVWGNTFGIKIVTFHTDNSSIK